MKKIIYIQILIVLLLSSCLVGKKYNRPDMKAPEKYVFGDTIVATTDSVVSVAAGDTSLNLQWFELFGDDVLNSLITLALDSNTNLRIAVQRVEQSRSYYKNANANIYPSFGYSASASIKDPADDNFDIYGTASWEIDF